MEPAIWIQMCTLYIILASSVLIKRVWRNSQIASFRSLCSVAGVWREFRNVQRCVFLMKRRERDGREDGRRKRRRRSIKQDLQNHWGRAQMWGGGWVKGRSSISFPTCLYLFRSSGVASSGVFSYRLKSAPLTNLFHSLLTRADGDLHPQERNEPWGMVRPVMPGHTIPSPGCPPSLVRPGVPGNTCNKPLN